MSNITSTSLLTNRPPKESALRVLLVADESLIRLSYHQRWFQGEKYIVNFAASSSEALVFLETYYANILVVNIDSFGKSVVDFLEQSIEISPETFRVVLGDPRNKSIGLRALMEGAAHQFKNIQWDEKPLKTVVYESIPLHSAMVQRHLRYLFSSFASLPAHISSQFRLRQLLDDKESSIRDLELEIEKHPALVAKILRIANSVFMGIRQPVYSVKQAIMFIGTEYIGTLLYAIEFFDFIYRKLNDRGQAFVDSVWNKALHRAQVARLIAFELLGEEMQNKAFITALMQDIGYLIRLLHQERRFYTMVKIANTSHLPMYEADRRIFAISHDDVGAALLRLWNFPDDIVQAVADHQKYLGGEDILNKIIVLAESLTSPEEAFCDDPIILGEIERWRIRLNNVS
jgi:HD-like signal output (HDOD) protein